MSYQASNEEATTLLELLVSEHSYMYFDKKSPRILKQVRRIASEYYDEDVSFQIDLVRDAILSQGLCEVIE